MSEIKKSDQAKLDLIEIADWLMTASGLALSQKFLDAAEETFHLLASVPLIGPLYEYTGEAAILRKFRVNHFPNHIIFYEPLSNGCEIKRVIYGARDLDAMFSEPRE